MKTLLLHSNEVGIAIRTVNAEDIALKEMVTMVWTHLYCLDKQKIMSVVSTKDSEMLCGNFENKEYRIGYRKCSLKFKDINLFLHWRVHPVFENQLQSGDLLDDVCE